MKRSREKGPARGAAWRVFLILTALILGAVLELGRHTLIGWILGAAAIAAFAVFRVRRAGAACRGVRACSWLILLAVLAGILALSWPPVRAVPAVEGGGSGVTEPIRIAQGELTGVVTDDGAVEVYAGVPYAQAPVGDLRWREPQPAEPWDGVLAADRFAPMSMQKTNLPIYDSLVRLIGYHEFTVSLRDNYRPPVSEDSLYLNIWKPAGDVSGCPVLVYVHGGSLQTGQPWYKDYGGQALARDGVVVVNMGYRLGVFGFFASEELAAESPVGTTGNYGLLDQIEALKWVRDNIAAFGGDPGNVTLAGESAGSACVSALCTSPLARGLFRRVVGESSTVTAPEPAHSFRRMESALQAGRETMLRFGAASAADLRAVPAEKLAGEMAVHHHLTVDGYALTETPWESYARGVHNEEAQLHGYNSRESAPFILFSQASMKNYESKVRAAFDEPYASRVLELYPASTDAEARAFWAEIYSAVLFSYGHWCWERQALAENIPTYVYYFTKTNRSLGPWHSGEMIYLYGNIPDRSPLYDEADRELSRVMRSYYRNFIFTGDPNGEGLPAWEKSSGGRTVMEFGDAVRPTDAPYQEMHRILDEMYGLSDPGDEESRDREGKEKKHEAAV